MVLHPHLKLLQAHLRTIKGLLYLVKEVTEKGSVQSIIPLKNKGAIRLTVSKYYLPSGKSISEVGVRPDIEVNEEGENFLKAAYRELEEETSIKSVELIKELDGTITYELPDRLLGIIWKGKYKGQKQKWFLMKFTGDDKEINIKTKNPEFLDWKWIDLDQITEVVVDFKLHVYKELKEKVKKIIN